MDSKEPIQSAVSELQKTSPSRREMFFDTLKNKYHNLHILETVYKENIKLSGKF